MARAAENESLSEALVRVIDATGRLLVENVRLARVEIEQQASIAAQGALWIGLALALALAGYGLLCAGGAIVLSARWGWGPALLALAGLNLLAGAFFFARGMKKVSQRSRAALPGSARELAPAQPAPALALQPPPPKDGAAA